ncbi:MAG: NAD(P)/FAD-dependent oxidoreductase [Gemmatimonadota bacterium]
MKTIVVGAGLSGSLMAIYLARAGHEVRLYEKRPDPRGSSAEGGRSINLALSTRGIHALEQVSAARPVLAESVAMRGRMMHSQAGKLRFQPYDAREDKAIRSVSRAGLNRHLIETADAETGVECVFGQACTGVDAAAGRVSFRGADGQTSSAEADLIIGADGAFSAVRASFQRADRFDYDQSYLTHAYKELSIPPAEGGGFRLEKNALHIWPRGGFMMIALPNADGSYTCTLFAPFEGDNSFASITSDGDVREYFEAHFPDATPHMPTLIRDFRDNPTSSLMTVRCGPWHRAAHVCLIGDAAHAVVPFYGQGMNASFEDCYLLSEALREHAPDVAAALAAFYSGRKEHADALADLAIQNFIEMRDSVASPMFLAGKGLERTLHRTFPGWFVPLYSMVTFSRIPYADAVRRSHVQVPIARGILIGIILLLIAITWSAFR